MIHVLFDKHEPYFRNVAIATLLLGAAIFAIGTVEWLGNLLGGAGFANPMLKVIGGLVVTSLGYIHLELEMIRIK